MLARHAESLYWAGRYIERAADTARIVDVTYHGLLESTPLEAEQAWRDLLSVLRLDASFAQRQRGVSAVSVSEFVVVDGDNPGSIVSAVARARENLRSVRELVTTDLWESINTFHLGLRLRDLRADLEQQPYELYRMVKERCQMVAGVAAETMPRDDGWRFLQLGWMLERAEMTCRLLDVRYGDGRTRDFHHWMGTLKSASALEAYRKTYRSSMAARDVIDFLLMSRTFPRSALFCLRRAESDLGLLGGDGQGLSRPERILGRIRSDLEFRDVAEVIDAGLHPYLVDLQAGVRSVAAAVADEYFRLWDTSINPLELHLAGAFLGE
jgi:uncharacterized alpha-E superfamily protein